MSRYLDPSRRWDAGSDDRLRRRLNTSARDRSEYRRVITLHRLMTGGDGREPSRVEDERRLDALLERFAVPGTTQALPTPHPRAVSPSLPLRAWITGLFGACAALVLVVFSGGPTAGPGWQPLPEYGGDITARGASDGDPELVGFGVTGVTEAGDEYEVLAAGLAYRGDYLRFSYTNDTPGDVGHLFLLGLQRGADGGVAIRWYAPEPGYGEAQSVATPSARARFFDFETKLATEHTEGALRFVGIFTHAPVQLATMRSALADLPLDEALSGPAAGFEAWLRVTLGLAPSARVQIHDTTVISGTRPTAPEPVEGP